MSAERGPGLVAAIVAALALRAAGAVPGRAKAEPAGTEGHGHPAGFESEDVDVGRTAWMVLALAVSVAAAIGAVAFLMHLFGTWTLAETPPFTPQQTATLRPPPPNLQGDPYADLARQEARDRAAVAGYAYTDAERRRARIPVERAMTLIEGRSLGPVEGAGR
ncbi:hypothetical protein [uncultured Methylobacterium sp.]|uniref:hypothetical protein n=1 Tax=uncultured Methylobacterium sp. TaxID=157278 RepID=UPI00261E0F36|nr:hypothetical protein [uncultured Methylobacterium sp.]